MRTVRHTLADGTRAVYYYDKQTGARIVTDAEPGTPAFEAAHRRARRLAARPARPRAKKRVKGAWEQIIEAYEKSPEYAGLAVKTRQDRDRYGRLVIKELGFQTFADLNSRRARTEFYEVRDRFKDTPAKADAVSGYLSTVLQFAYDRGLVDVNHAREIKRLTTDGARKDIIVTAEMESALLAKCPHPDLRRAYLLATLTLARQGDLCRLTEENLRDGWLVWTPAKTARSTGAIVQVPVFAYQPLADLVEELLAQPKIGDGPRPLLQWDGPRGRRPLCPSNLDLNWRPWRDAVLGPGADIHWHDLRGTGVTRLYEAGCTDAEVTAISGHATKAETSVRDYQARTRKLALAAFTKLAAATLPAPENVVALAARRV